MSAEMSSASGCLTLGGFSSAIAYGLFTQYSFVTQHVEHMINCLPELKSDIQMQENGTEQGSEYIN